MDQEIEVSAKEDEHKNKEDIDVTNSEPEKQSQNKYEAVSLDGLFEMLIGKLDNNEPIDVGNDDTDE